MTRPARSLLKIDSGTQALLWLDERGRVLTWSVASERVTGHAPGMLAGLPLMALFEPAGAAGETLPRVLVAARSVGSAERDGELRRADGRRIAARLHVDAAADGESEVGFLATIQVRDMAAEDVHRRAEQALIQSEVHAAVGRLAAGIAHRFNNVLAAMLGSLEVLCHRLPAPQQAMPLVDTALRAGARGSMLTHHLLTYAQKQTLNLGPVDVHDIVEQAAQRLRAECNPDIRLRTDAQISMPLVTDVEELTGALVHLGENARDAMPDGGEIRIEARIEHVVDNRAHALGLAPGEYVCFRVSDNGRGIDPQIQAHVTEPFFTTHGPAERLGLGLSTVRGFAEQCLGRLVLDSVVGRGTVAEMWLPLGKSAHVTPSSESPSTSAEHREATVLLVDDDELVLVSTSGLLEELGWRVLSAPGGAQALEIIAANPDIDVVLTDFVMPGMSGADLAQAIRYMRPDLPVVLTSGGELGGAAPDNLPRLTKPYAVQELAATLRRVAH